MSLSRSARTVVSKIEIKCKKCKIRKIRITTDENYETCQVCYGIFKINLSGNKIIDEIIRNTQVNFVTGSKDWILEFIPYDQFKDIEFIAEGGFSKIYKAIWVDGPIDYFSFKPDTDNIVRKNNFSVVLKRLNNSNNITSEELNELKVYYQILSNDMISNGIGEYFGITQEPITKDMMIIMPHYELGDLMRYLSNNFYNISWRIKLDRLSSIILGLVDIHRAKIIHRDLHSGNIFFDKDYAYIGDLGISRSATESNNDNERYGIIPYMAPEIFHGQKYTEASDIYSFGMIMWEFMTGRRPFLDKNHDTELIIKIIDGLRPPIVTNAPKGYIELMKRCWHPDPVKRPIANDISEKIDKMWLNEEEFSELNQTEIIESSDIGPATIKGPGAIYKSRPLSCMIQSAMSLRSSRSQTNDPFYYYQKNNLIFSGKRKFEDDSVDDNDQSIKRRKFLEDEYNDYFTKEIELDINMSSNQPCNNGYITKEIDFDINDL